GVSIAWRNWVEVKPRIVSPARTGVKGGPPTNNRASTIRTRGGGAGGAGWSGLGGEGSGGAVPVSTSQVDPSINASYECPHSSGGPAAGSSEDGKGVSVIDPIVLSLGNTIN